MGFTFNHIDLVNMNNDTLPPVDFQGVYFIYKHGLSSSLQCPLSMRKAMQHFL